MYLLGHGRGELEFRDENDPQFIVTLYYNIIQPLRLVKYLNMWIWIIIWRVFEVHLHLSLIFSLIFSLICKVLKNNLGTKANICCYSCLYADTRRPLDAPLQVFTFMKK